MNDTARGAVVVGVDGSESDQKTLRWAAAEASRRQRELLVVHAQDLVDGGAESESPVTSLLFEGRDFARDLISQSVRSVSRTFPALPVRSLTRPEEPAHLLLEQSKDAAVMVLGTHGDNRFVGALLGSVSQKLAAHAFCPVVVLPADAPDDEDPPHTVVVGVSSSVGGRAALQFAFAQARSMEVELVAVRCWREWPLFAASGAGIGFVMPPIDDVLRDGEQVILDDCLAQVQPDFPDDVKVRAELAEKPTDAVLVDYSSRAALLVVGCRHEDGHRLSRLGPIGSWLLHNSKAPIAIVGFKAAPVAG